MIKFEWNANKALSNMEKHGVSFEEASSVFNDEFAIQYYDPDHSVDEDRFILLGNSNKTNTLVVCHSFRKTDTVIRIISARKANKHETIDYWSTRI